MKFTSSDIPGLLTWTPKVHGDARGFFLESYNKKSFAEAGLDVDFIQDNHAMSLTPGVLRGLHFQAPPSAQAKLVWVTRGAVFDVVVDLRKGSPAYGRWAGFTLSAANFTRLFVPRGFAHGYVTLEEQTEFMYKVDGFYDASAEGGLKWDDPGLAIDWPVDAPILSDKDKLLPSFADFDSPFEFEG